MPSWPQPLIVLSAFGLGSVVGSFLNVLIYRVPRRISIIRPGSACPACDAAIRWFDNIPILSWLLLRARCRRCGARISIRYPAVEAAAGLIAVLTAGHYGLGLVAVEVVGKTGMGAQRWIQLGPLQLQPSELMKVVLAVMLARYYDWLGKGRFILLLICSAVVGDVLHIIGDPGSEIPCIGASGGISGIIAFYALKFPRVKLGFLLCLYHYIRWIRMPACAMFLIWLAIQFFGAWKQLAGFSNVSFLAHLGGAGVGCVFWILTRKKFYGEC